MAIIIGKEGRKEVDETELMREKMKRVKITPVPIQAIWEEGGTGWARPQLSLRHVCHSAAAARSSRAE